MSEPGELLARRGAVREQQLAFRAVTAITGVVVGLAFLFGFGNVWTLALRLGVSAWVAPLVAPAVDLSVLALLLAIRYLALYGAPETALRPARRLLLLASLLTLALNVTEPLLAGAYGRAAFDAVGPLLLIGWAEVGPGLLQAISGIRADDVTTLPRSSFGRTGERLYGVPVAEYGSWDDATDDLLDRARVEDARHWQTHRRPISAETLRKCLHIGAARSRALVAVLRAGGVPAVDKGVHAVRR
ncbi:SpdA protein [Streptomyces sp. NBC_01622]|uniref:SpdA protein n=1 Tax=unclassified Streptomyces TaxID=2593676 RepID=UPI00295B95D2|nr:SpdA protein [Streptomyces sp. W16]MDV9172858.1 SpdA protein [Streptomyces sp. W16]WTE48768.1 SpdA protein [Streptomyces sp. NBC_01622]